ncbi:hypothetical protein SNEBB_004070 [Seison nebaliae]|nr:hypothetical protein SNEBB_004070 [Seison nebaliae]
MEIQYLHYISDSFADFIIFFISLFRKVWEKEDKQEELDSEIETNGDEFRCGHMELSGKELRENDLFRNRRNDNLILKNYLETNLVTYTMNRLEEERNDGYHIFDVPVHQLPSELNGN